VATLSAIGRERKAQLRQLRAASRRLDTKQEALEREIRRIIERKRAIPELKDGERLATLATAVAVEMNNVASVINSLSHAWGLQYNYAT